MHLVTKAFVIPAITALAAFGLATSTAWAENKEVTLNLGGKFCEFYPEEITAALKKLPGVQSVNAAERQKFVIVRYETAKVTPEQMVTAIAGVKEEGKWHCEARVK